MFGDIRSYRGIEPDIAEHVYIDPSAVLVGDIHIGEHSSVWPLVAARGDVNKIRIGKRTNIQDNTTLHVASKSASNPEGYPLIIGDDVTVGHQAMLHACRIGNRVLVGMSATVMDGAVVEDDVIIGAGTVVPPGKHLEAGHLYVGNPMKKVRALTEQEKEFLKVSAAKYVQLKDEYIANVQSL